MRVFHAEHPSLRFLRTSVDGWSAVPCGCGLYYLLTYYLRRRNYKADAVRRSSLATLSALGNARLVSLQRRRRAHTHARLQRPARAVRGRGWRRRRRRDVHAIVAVARADAATPPRVGRVAVDVELWVRRRVLRRAHITAPRVRLKAWIELRVPAIIGKGQSTCELCQP